MLVAVRCTQCRRLFEKERGQLNRALRAIPGRMYCSRKCAGLARRIEKPPIEVRRARKAAYDLVRRNGPMRDEILAAKRDAYRENRDPLREAAKRLKKRDWQRAYAKSYNADPSNKRRKRRYDMRRRGRALKEWASAHRVLLRLEREIRRIVPDKYERLKARGYYGQGRSTQERKRHEQVSRW